MKKLFAFSLIGSSLLFSAQHAKADWDFWAVDYSGDSSIGNRIYTCVSATGTCTQRSTELFQNNGWQPANSYVDDDNNLVIYGSGGTLHSYDLDTDTWTDTGTGWTGNYQKVFERPDIVKNSDGSVTVGQGDSVISIDNCSRSFLQTTRAASCTACGWISSLRRRARGAARARKVREKAQPKMFGKW